MVGGRTQDKMELSHLDIVNESNIEIINIKMPADNKRFCEMAAEVLARILVLGKTDSRNPNCSAVEPPLRKAAGTLGVSRRQRSRQRNEKLKNKQKIGDLIRKTLIISIVILTLVSCKQNEVGGIIIGNTLYENQSVSDNRKLRKLVCQTLNKDEKALSILNNFQCGGGAGCYDLGFIVTQIIYRLGEQEFINMVSKLNSEEYISLKSLIEVGLEYGDNDRDGKMDEKKIENEFPSLYKLLKSEKNIQLQETFNEEDIPVNDYLTDRLQPIRENFKKINSITNWSSIDKKSLWETTEGGSAEYYYLYGQLEKIVARHFGETFQQLTEYYLLNGQLSFVFEKSYKYNRPIYYDTTMMRENNDKEFFGLDISVVIEDRSYFEKGKLIHKLESQDCGAPFADDYLLEEQKRIKTNFEKLIELIKKK